MNAVAERITDELRTLIGKPMWDCWRAMNMQIFEFGARRPIINRKGEEVEVGEVRLHVQCRWRLGDGKQILFGRDDLNYPADDKIPLEDFDWDQEKSVLDVKQRAWFRQNNAEPPNVVEVHGDLYGGFQIQLEGGFTLEALPCDSRLDDELWRLIGHHGDQSHFVVTGNGVECRGIT